MRACSGTEEVDDGISGTENGSPEEDNKGNGIWCLNLGRVRELEKTSLGQAVPTFRHTSDPRKDVKNVHGAPLQIGKPVTCCVGLLIIQMSR